MAVTIAGTSTSAAGTANGSSVTFAWNNSASANCLLVGVSSWDATPANAEVSGVTYAGVAMTLVGQRQDGGGNTVSIWRLLNPTTGSNNVIVTMGGACDEFIAGATGYAGANATTPVSGFVGADGSGGTGTVNVASATGNICFAVYYTNANPAVGAGQTQQWEVFAYGGTYGAASTEAGGATVTMSWTQVSNSWIICACSVDAASGTVFNQSVAGTLTSAGAIAKRDNKVLVGTLTSSGLLNKFSARSFTGVLTSSGLLSKLSKKTFTGGLTTTGLLIKQVSKVFTGNLTLSGAITERSNKVLTGILTTSGSLIKQCKRALAGTLTTTGALAAIKTIVVVLTGALNFSGSLTILDKKSLSGVLTTSGDLVKQYSKTLSGILTFSGELVSSTSRIFLKALTRTLSFVGTLTSIKILAPPSSAPAREPGGVTYKKYKFSRWRKK